MSVGVVTVGSIWRHLCVMSHCPGCWPSWGLEYFFWNVWSMTTGRVLNLWTMDWGDNAKKRSPTIAWSWLCSIQKYKSATSKWTWKCGSQTFKRCERACCGGYVFINNTWQSTPLECVWNEILFGLCLGSWCLTFKSKQAEFSWLLWARWVSLKVQLYLLCMCICQSSYLHCCIWICPSSHLSQVSHSHQVTHTQTGKIV